jgi:enamine deaminase RidA (YjgF/YER057c/UK114 family)
LVFVSGQTAGDLVGVEAQTRAILERIGTILRAASSDHSAVLRCGVYLSDIRTFEQMNAVYREFFPKEQPTRTTIECKMASPSVLVEIDCIACVA